MRQEGSTNRFIPFPKSQLVDMLLDDGDLEEKEKSSFRKFCEMLESIYHYEFHEKEEILVSSYYPFDPDRNDGLKDL